MKITIQQIQRIVVSVALIATSSNLMANIIFFHNGAVDPTTEGWARVQQGGPGTSEGPVINDLGVGINAWNITDTSSSPNSVLGYSQTLTAEQLTAASTNGWTLSTRLRVLNPLDIPDSSSIIEFSDGTTVWSMDFGSDADGDPTVVLRTGFDGTQTLGPAFTLEGVGSTYHDYDLIFDPLAGTADLFVDGIERISDHGGKSTGLERVIWGAIGSVTQGNTNYEAVSFSVVPVPAAVWLLGSGLIVLFGVARRK